MAHPWIPNSVDGIRRAMLEYIGVGDVSELYKDIPEDVRFKARDWDMLPIGFGRPLSEIEVSRHMD
ncbi:MAG: glycine dehydrogenase, partial [Acidilobaceae archaeon]